ncbi:hypothetical protein P9112_004718 [Eukaryota sp. TZLM1-RC]
MIFQQYIHILSLFLVISILAAFLLKWLQRTRPKQILLKLASCNHIPPSVSATALLTELDSLLLKRGILPPTSPSCDNLSSISILRSLSFSSTSSSLFCALSYYFTFYKHLSSTFATLQSLVKHHNPNPADPSTISQETLALCSRVHQHWFGHVPSDVLNSKYWLDLGFQGPNPVRDFRGVGLMPITILLRMGELNYGKAIHEHSIKFDWPFALGVISVCKDLLDLINIPNTTIRRRLLSSQGMDGVVFAVLDGLSVLASEWEVVSVNVPKERRILEWPRVYKLVQGSVVKGKDYGCFEQKFCDGW